MSLSSLHRAAQALLLLTGIPALILGCTPGKVATPDRHMRTSIPLRQRDAANEWVLAWDNPLSSEPAYVTNGVIGVRIGRDGSGTSDPMLEMDEYSEGRDESILPIKNPMKIGWSVAGRPIGTLDAKNYSQTLDMRTGVLRTTWTQPAGDVAVAVLTKTAIHPNKRVLVQRWQFTATGKAAVSLELNASRAAHLSSAGTGPYPIASSDRTFVCQPGKPIEIELCWNLEDAETLSFTNVEKASTSELARQWSTDIKIDGPVEDQQSIRAWLYYLRASISPKSLNAVSPMSLSSTIYKGHVFWDADTWVFPALCLLDPSRARVIPDYRVLHIGQAVQNAFKSNPQGTDELRYPWESAISGAEVAPEEFRKQVHVTADVAFMLYQAGALGLVDSRTAASVGRRANNFYLHLAQRRGGKLELRNVRGPDEYHVADNDLYTNVMAQWLEDRYGGAQETYKLPRDATTFLARDADPLINYGQADAVLAIYPAQNSAAEADALKMMNRFPPLTTRYSPAMTDSVEALIWARLGDTDRAYQEWRRSWRDFSRHPLSLFSEERSKDRTYFMTGAAGCLQTVLYGFLGFRIDWKLDPKAPWASKLHGGNWLTVSPHIPEQWKKITFQNFTLLGKRLTLTATHNGTSVTQGEP